MSGSHRNNTTLASLLAAFALLSSIVAPVAAKSPSRDTLYQISTIDALMAGLYDGELSIGQLVKHGDFGLGTFQALDGEMVVLDGTVYQVTSDGVVRKPARAMTTPFAAVTYLDKDETLTIPGEMTLPKLQEYLDSALPSKNLFYAIRIDGAFARVRTRSVPSQKKPYPRLVDVTREQREFEFTNVTGTIVALRCPYFVKGVNVPGYHMHFISSDKSQGGHLLDCTIKSGTAVVDTTPNFELTLPNDKNFYRTDFSGDNQKDLDRAEKGTR